MFILNNHNPVPLYKQLYNQIREHVLSGKLLPDTRLPSVRDLAAELSTSRNTVEGAYQELYAEGYIYSKPRSGYFVSALDQDAAPLSLSRNLKAHKQLPGPPAIFPFDFHPARLDPESFPTALWRKCYSDSLRQNSQQLVQYGDPQGDWGLRCSIQSYLERSRGVLCNPDQIVICSGLQQGLDVVAHLLKDHHSVVAVENPGYFLPRSVFSNHSYKIFSVPVRPGGLDLDCLKASNSTIVYVTPSHQLPLGYVMPVANRLKLIEWAEEGGNFIIEDDYDSELRYHGRPIPSLQGLRPQGNIIYSGTFSKILSPALRVSYLVLPSSLLAKYRQLYRDYFPTVSLLEQRTLAIFMEQGHWERHVRRMRIIYKNKHNALLCAIEHYFGSRAVVIGQGAGLHLVLQLPGSSLSAVEINERARPKGVRLFPFSDFYLSGGPESTTLLVGFGGMTATEIELGIKLLSQVCNCPDIV
ncbi:putative HTH-type transcriptional regulator YdeL [Geobacter sp. OR-1]|uniref:MocR-like pyridoxine biosynthesis transcription factor PdxR n=1 Tax=Geobacter sp. OR-1 TaxID=1266765 RepID=UPI0005433C10|nr:PLP-dependent aminotransferase family protein [Geobacter sp. OR-1]GAM10853.1 putative HTH-type transcriptional regulator YdeL [Geobacter sp. OR-1]